MPINLTFGLSRLAGFWPRTDSGSTQHQEIERAFVKSRQLTSLGYDPAREILEVEFNNGLIYQASGVAKFEFEELMQSSDLDFGFSQRIMRRHEFQRIGRVCPLF